MIRVTAEIDLDDVWEQLDDEDLISEMNERGIFPKPEEFDLDKVEALDTLRQAADLFRAANRPNMGLAIDNLIESLQL